HDRQARPRQRGGAERARRGGRGPGRARRQLGALGAPGRRPGRARPLRARRGAGRAAAPVSRRRRAHEPASRPTSERRQRRAPARPARRATRRLGVRGRRTSTSELSARRDAMRAGRAGRNDGDNPCMSSMKPSGRAARPRGVAAGALLALGLGCGRQTPDVTSTFYERKIDPILRSGCANSPSGSACHLLQDQRGNALGNLSFEDYEALSKRRDLLVPYGPYAIPNLLLKALPPFQLPVTTWDDAEATYITTD